MRTAPALVKPAWAAQQELSSKQYLSGFGDVGSSSRTWEGTQSSALLCGISGSLAS